MPISVRQGAKGRVYYDVYIQDAGKKVWKRGFRLLKGRDPELHAEAYEAQQLSLRNQGFDISKGRVTVAAWLARWQHDYVAGLAPSTRVTYEINLKHVIPVIGEKRLRDLKPADVQQVYGRITSPLYDRDGKMLRKALSRKTALNVHRVLREALDHAVRLELVGRNVCDAVIAPKADRYVFKPQSLEEIDAMLAAADATIYGRMVRLSLWTGLRQGECISLQKGDINLTASELRVVRGTGPRPKWGSEGTIVLSEDAVLILRDQLRWLKEQQLALGPAWQQTAFVFTDNLGGQIDASAVRRKWRALEKKFGIEMRFHDLRHNHASLLIQAGAHPKVIQERMRHKNWSTTMDTYGHLFPGMMDDAARRFDETMKRSNTDIASGG